MFENVSPANPHDESVRHSTIRFRIFFLYFQYTVNNFIHDDIDRTKLLYEIQVGLIADTESSSGFGGSGEGTGNDKTIRERLERQRRGRKEDLL